MEKLCIIIRQLIIQKLMIQDTTQEETILYKEAVNAMVDRVSLYERIKDIDNLIALILYRITNFSQECVTWLNDFL